MLQRVVCSNNKAFYTACKLKCLHLKQISTIFSQLPGPLNLKTKSDTICFLWIHVPVVLNNHEGSARSSKNTACPISTNFLAQSPLKLPNICVVHFFVVYIFLFLSTVDLNPTERQFLLLVIINSTLKTSTKRQMLCASLCSPKGTYSNLNI